MCDTTNNTAIAGRMYGQKMVRVAAYAAWLWIIVYGHLQAGVFGYSHFVGGFAGGQAEYARVPFADSNLLAIVSLYHISARSDST